MDVGDRGTEIIGQQGASLFTLFSGLHQRETKDGELSGRGINIALDV